MEGRAVGILKSGHAGRGPFANAALLLLPLCCPGAALVLPLCCPCAALVLP